MESFLYLTIMFAAITVLFYFVSKGDAESERDFKRFLIGMIILFAIGWIGILSGRVG